jgi:N-acetylglucosamine-6-sulfatase
MPQGKWNVYDNDLRIPWVIRGPGIMPGTTFDNVASQVDTIPTILGLAGASVL